MRMKNNLILANSSRAEESRGEQKRAEQAEESRQTDRQWQRQTKFVINAKSHVEQCLYTPLCLLLLPLSISLSISISFNISSFPSHFPLRCLPANYLKNLLNFHIRIKQQQPVSFNALLRCLPAGPGLRSLSPTRSLSLSLLLLPYSSSVSFSPPSMSIVYAVIEFMYILHFAARTSCSRAKVV